MENNNEKQIEEILTRGVSEFIDPENRLKEKLKNNSHGIVVKYGIDPTKPDIHLGHAACLRKLKQLQKVGCKIVFLIGDFTALIGDPTGKDKTRPLIDGVEISKNVDSYINQIPKLLITKQDDIKKINATGEEIGDFEVVFNFDWYNSIHDFMPDDFIEKTKQFMLNNAELVKRRSELIKGVKILDGTEIKLKTITIRTFFKTLSGITHSDLFERSTFRDRYEKKQEIFMHEFLYPILQGIDSFIIGDLNGSCDLEIGGTDQLINMKIGQKIQKTAKQEQQAIMIVKLLEGTDGKEKMSKSLDNYIGITEEPNQMFGKVMSIPDTSIMNYFELCTDVPMENIKQKGEDMKSGKLNPRDAKLELATEIVKIYHGEKEAEKAQKYFVDTFSKRETPSDIPEVKVDTDAISLLDFLILSGNAKSKGEARRKIEQGGVSIDGEKVGEMILNAKEHDGKVMKVGKIHFVKIKF